MRGLRLAARIATTLVVILLWVPVLVIAAAHAGRDPRHWSGTRLSYVRLGAYDASCSGFISDPKAKHTQADLDAVSGRVLGEHLDSVHMTGPDPCHDRLEVMVPSLDHATLFALSKYGDALAVRLDPYWSCCDELQAAVPTSTKADANVAAGSYRILPFWLSHEDPVGTWFTLLTGFPLYLGSVVGALAAWWALAVVRYRRRPQPAATSLTT